MSERDKLIGQSVATLRGDLSQKEVADRMKERGWKWSQATVWSVEKGDRPLRLTEAQDLADVLKTNVLNFTRTPDAVTVELHKGAVQRAEKALIEAIRGYRSAQFRLAVAADKAEAKGDRLYSEGGVVGKHLTHSIEDIVRDERAKIANDTALTLQRLETSMQKRGVEFERSERRWMNHLMNMENRGEHPEEA